GFPFVLIVFKSIIRKGSPFFYTQLEFSLRNCSSLHIKLYSSEDEATACLNYIKSKFARAMLGILKTTQANTRSKWEYVPLQDFTPNSDIDWTKSIPEIDQQLYKKYNLSEEEINFIETKVQAMD
ncbi:hypothetical protein LOB68_04350, partial [Lactobacillus delbrueckii subsp. lactis]|nr:hypothetical protein [Lactobacillus delbrueckii subsp. lactis]